jgi:hypothetical protein
LKRDRLSAAAQSIPVMKQANFEEAAGFPARLSMMPGDAFFPYEDD